MSNTATFLVKCIPCFQTMIPKDKEEFDQLLAQKQTQVFSAMMLAYLLFSLVAYKFAYPYYVALCISCAHLVAFILLLIASGVYTEIYA